MAETDPPGSVSGELRVYVASHEDGRRETNYVLHTADDRERPLLFADPPAIAAGTALRVWGAEGSESSTLDPTVRALQVRSWEVLPKRGPSSEIASQTEPLTNVTPEPSRKMCVIMVDLGTAFNAMAKATIEQSFFTGSKSVDAFYRENSYGKDGLDGAVYGPFSYKMSSCDYQGMSKAVKANMPAGVTCDQYAYVFPSSSLCSWGGLGAVGTPDAPARDTWYNGSVSCVVAVQEPGHNYGMAHSSSLSCKTTTFATDPTTSCTHSEYGDKFDPMGGACRHMNVWQKQYEQWLGGCNSVNVTASGTFNLLPTELACDGIQALQVAMPKPVTYSRPAGGGSQAGNDALTSYYLEYRTSAGFDTGMTPTVLLHVGGNYRNGKRLAGMHTWLLDMHPGGSNGFNDAGFKAGETFTDPAGGLTITVESMDADKAVVHIERANGTGEPTCLETTAKLTLPGPASCGTPAPPPPDDAGASVMPPPVKDAGVVDSMAPPKDSMAPPRAEAGSPEAMPPTIDAGSTPSKPNGSDNLPAVDAGAPVVIARPDAAIELVTPNGSDERTSDVVGGCSCRVANGGSARTQHGSIASGLALAMGLAWRGRRRRARRTSAD